MFYTIYKKQVTPMEKCDISIIVVVNNLEIFNKMAKPSIENQKFPYQLIAIDNQKNRFPSAAQAYNHAVRYARGEYVMFCHQDLRFSDDRWLEKAYTYLSCLPKLGIAGIAGARAGKDPNQRVLLSNIKDNNPPQRTDHVSLSEPRKVQTVDECAFFVPRKLLKRHRFDQTVCGHWHLYAVDYALTVTRDSLASYVLPMNAYHLSGGDVVRGVLHNRLPAAYHKSLKKVIKKHGDQHHRIYTTCGVWNCRKPLFMQTVPWKQVVKSMGARIKNKISKRIKFF